MCIFLEKKLQALWFWTCDLKEMMVWGVRYTKTLLSFLFRYSLICAAGLNVYLLHFYEQQLWSGFLKMKSFGLTFIDSQNCHCVILHNPEHVLFSWSQKPVFSFLWCSLPLVIKHALKLYTRVNCKISFTKPRIFCGSVFSPHYHEGNVAKKVWQKGVASLCFGRVYVGYEKHECHCFVCFNVNYHPLPSPPYLLR